IPLGPHDLSAARAGRENPERRAAVMRLPERQMWRVRKQVHQSHLALRAADFKKPLARELQIVQIVPREQKWNRVCGPAGCARHENRPKLGLKTVPDSLAAVAHSAQNRGGTMREYLRVRDQQEVPDALRMFRSVQ